MNINLKIYKKIHIHLNFFFNFRQEPEVFSHKKSQSKV